MVVALLEGNADPLIESPSGTTAYSLAKDSRRLVVAATILEACVIRGIINDDVKTVMNGVKEGAYINIRTSGGWNPLIFVSALGDAAAVTELIALGAEVNNVENEDWSPLHFAAANNFTDVVSALLRSHIDVTLTNEDGNTARGLASELGHIEIVKMIDESTNTEL